MSTADVPSPPPWPPPPRPPPSFPPGYVPAFIFNSGSCTGSVHDGMSCFDSPNYPDLYPNDASCNITLGGVSKTLTAVAFGTESCCDILVVNGVGYAGLGPSWTAGLTGNTGPSGPDGVVAGAGSSILFSSDSSNTFSGFRICAGAIGIRIRIGARATSSYVESSICTVKRAASKFMHMRFSAVAITPPRLFIWVARISTYGAYTGN